MQKLFFSFLFVLSICFSALSQDLITTKEGQDIMATVLEVNPDEVKYKLFSEPDGATYTVKKSQLLRIRYKSGREEVFSSTSLYDIYQNQREPVKNLRVNMKYKELRRLYNTKDYVPMPTDRHSPGWSGVASFFIPGLGECINNEWGRGLGKFFSSWGLALVGRACLVSASASDETIQGANLLSAGAVCCGAAIVIDIWSIVDAVKIAKTKNMYEQDLMKDIYAVNLNISPSFEFVPVGTSQQVVSGVKLAIVF